MWECGDESSGSINHWEFFDYLRNGSLLKKDCAPLNVEKVLVLTFYIRLIHHT